MEKTIAATVISELEIILKQAPGPQDLFCTKKTVFLPRQSRDVYSCRQGRFAGCVLDIQRAVYSTMEPHIAITSD